MYIDTVPNRSSPPAILLRESDREGGKVKKRTLANLSKLPAAIIELVRQALSGRVPVLGEAVSGVIFGVVFVLHALARQSSARGLPVAGAGRSGRRDPRRHGVKARSRNVSRCRP
jgi:hypothetical protein